MKRLTIGILAHVDAGKTTLAESLLYTTGSIRKLGRVDHKDAFLDTFELERQRGITIFSKQAKFTLDDMEVTLLDTPGHVDFSAEMERTLQVLDYAILVISGSDGVQGHTETLWRLLSKYQIPTFLFINKMDMEGNSRDTLLQELKSKLNDGCINFSHIEDSEGWMEELAMSDEALLESFLEDNYIEESSIPILIHDRKIFPCYFGSALKLNGVDSLIFDIKKYSINPIYKDDFAAKVFKISRDEQGNRLTYMKITGGSLKVKKLLSNETTLNKDKLQSMDIWEEKVEQIRIYSGTKYETIEEGLAGMVCAVTGLTKTYPGEGLGAEERSHSPILQAVLNYQLILPTEIDPFMMLQKLRILEEEDPKLHILWHENLKEIHIQLMGEVQVEVLKSVIEERFGIKVGFGSGNIVYKESIGEAVIGIGHFEPLRHYAEVHLMLEPGEIGSGITIDSLCSEDVLGRNWQNAVINHIKEKEHIGVLTGSPITDIRITLVNGRAHLKHTEGGDFRQATYRAIRHGLKRGKSVLLEPYYSFRLDVPAENIGRAMNDLSKMHGSFSNPHTIMDMAVIKGTVPVSTFSGYHTEVLSYTKGRGKLTCTLNGYDRCHNQDEVIEKMKYDSEADFFNPTSSVFCAHGAGFVVEWDKVEDYAHLESGINASKKEVWNQDIIITEPKTSSSMVITEDELEDIFKRTYGGIKQKVTSSYTRFGHEKKSVVNTGGYVRPSNPKKNMNLKTYLLVDGYNIIFSWEDLNELAKFNMDGARTKLMDILCNYQGYKNYTVIIVFDAYRVKGNIGEVIKYNNINVVYTKEAETADSYIEKTTNDLTKEHNVIVATSDALEQMIIMGFGATRLSAKDLHEDIQRISDEMKATYIEKNQLSRNSIGDAMSETFERINRQLDKHQK